MTLVNIDLRNQGYETGPDDRVIFYSLLVREGDFGTISTAPVEVPLVDGKASADLAPGPVGVQIIAGQVADTRVREGRVPMEGPTTLNVVLTLLPEYSDAVRESFLAAIRSAKDKAIVDLDQALDGELQQYRDYASEAITIATNVDQRVSGLEGMAGVSPQSPVDGQTANLLTQPGTLTRVAVDTAIMQQVSASLVVHLYRADAPRPTTPHPVIWYGFVVPDNMRNGDTLYKFFPKPPPFIQMISNFSDLEGWTPIGLHPEGWSADGGAITYVSTSDTTEGPKVLAYGGVPDARNQDVEVVAKTSATAMNTRGQGGLIVRGSGGEALNGYSVAYSQITGGRLFLGAYDNGVWRPLTDRLFLNNSWRTEPVWVRLRAEGSRISAKLWVDSEPEPANWSLSADDTAHTGGYVGVRTSQYGENITEKWHLVGIATDGETAPKETQ